MTHTIGRSWTWRSKTAPAGNRASVMLTLPATLVRALALPIVTGTCPLAMESKRCPASGRLFTFQNPALLQDPGALRGLG